MLCLRIFYYILFFRFDVDFVILWGNFVCIFDVLNGKDGKGWKWILLVMCFRGIVYLSYIEDVDCDY